MSSEITIYDTTYANPTLPGASINITVSGDDLIYTDEHDVEYTILHLQADLDTGDDELTINATGSGLPLNYIRAIANGDGVESMISWTTSGSPPTAAIYTITRPARSGQMMEWKLGDSIPPVKLKVKIARK